VVVDEGKAVAAYEVTSKTANKGAQQPRRNVSGMREERLSVIQKSKRYFTTLKIFQPNSNDMLRRSKWKII